jgi:fibronectin-binding autotransporter adhesin
MSAYTPPTYNVTPFNQAYFATSSGISLATASGLFLNKTSADTATALETFTGGVAVNTIQPTATATTMLINSTMTSGDMYIGANVAANNARTGVIHIGDSNGISSGGAVHINNGTTNTSNTNINNGTTSSGNLNLMTGASCSGSINIGSGNSSNPTANILTGQNCTGIVNIASASVGTNTVITNIGNGNTSGQINIGNVNNATVIGGTCGIGDSNSTTCNVTIANGNGRSNSVLIACGTGTNGSTVGICTGTSTGAVTLGNTNNTVQVNGSLTIGTGKNITLSGTVAPTSTQLGYVLPPVTATVASVGIGTATDICNTGSLVAGTYIVTFNILFPNIASGQCLGWINTVSATYSGNKGLIAIAGGSSNQTQGNCIYMSSSTSSLTFYGSVQLATTGGSCTGTISATRIA